MGCLLLLIIAFFIIYLWPIALFLIIIGAAYGVYDLWILQPKRIEAIKKSRVVSIEGSEFKHGIPIQIFEELLIRENAEKSQPKTMVQIAIPYLKENGSVEITESLIELRRVTPVEFKKIKTNSYLNNIANISSTVKEFHKIKEEENKLEKQYLKTTELAMMIKQSKLYASQLKNHEKLLLQIEFLLEKSHSLQGIYFDIIKENLLFYKIASSSSDIVPEGLHFSFSAQQKQAKEEYQYLKDTVSSYFEILEENMTDFKP